MLNLDTVHSHVVFIFKKGSMEVYSSIEVFDLSLQSDAPSSISEEASSFSHEYFLENDTCYQTTHELLSAMFPISQAIPLKGQALLHHKVDCIDISIIPILLKFPLTY